MFSFTGDAVTNPDLTATINGNVLAMVKSVAYLRIAFSSNAKWTIKGPSLNFL